MGTLHPVATIRHDGPEMGINWFLLQETIFKNIGPFQCPPVSFCRISHNTSEPLAKRLIKEVQDLHGYGAGNILDVLLLFAPESQIRWQLKLKSIAENPQKQEGWPRIVTGFFGIDEEATNSDITKALTQGIQLPHAHTTSIAPKRQKRCTFGASHCQICTEFNEFFEIEYEVLQVFTLRAL